MLELGQISEGEKKKYKKEAEREEEREREREKSLLPGSLARLAIGRCCAQEKKSYDMAGRRFTTGSKMERRQLTRSSSSR